MLYVISRPLAACVLTLFTQFTSLAQTAPGFTKLPDGIIVRLKPGINEAPRLVKLQVITDRILRITASPLDSFSPEKSFESSTKSNRRSSTASEYRFSDTATGFIYSRLFQIPRPIKQD